MSLSTKEVLPSGLKVDRIWWYNTKLIIAVVVGATAAFVVASLT